MGRQSQVRPQRPSMLSKVGTGLMSEMKALASETKGSRDKYQDEINDKVKKAQKKMKKVKKEAKKAKKNLEREAAIASGQKKRRRRDSDDAPEPVVKKVDVKMVQAEFASDAKAKRDARKAGGSSNDRVVWKGSQAFAKCKEGEPMEKIAAELGIDTESIISLNRLTFKGITPFMKMKGGDELLLPWSRTAQQQDSAKELAQIRHGRTDAYAEDQLGPGLNDERGGSRLEQRIKRNKTLDALEAKENDEKSPHNIVGRCIRCIVFSIINCLGAALVATYACIFRIDKGLFNNDIYRELLTFLCVRGLEQIHMVTAFGRADRDGGGTVSIQEFLKSIRIPWSSFAEKVFGVFDLDGSGEIDFEEWAFAMWNYCTMSYDEIAMFTFDCYSEEGVMHHEHIENLMVDNFTLKYVENPSALDVRNQLRRLAGSIDVGIDVHTFVEVAKDMQYLLHESIKYQHLLRANTHGNAMWDRIEKRRRAKFQNKPYDVVYSSLSAHMATIKARKDELAARKAAYLEGDGTEGEGKGEGEGFERVKTVDGRPMTGLGDDRPNSVEFEELEEGHHKHSGAGKKHHKHHREKVSCMCKGNCSSLACACFKAGKRCGHRCGCNVKVDGILVSGKPCMNCDFDFDDDGNEVHDHLNCGDDDIKPVDPNEPAQIFKGFRHLDPGQQSRLVNFLQAIDETNPVHSIVDDFEEGAYDENEKDGFAKIHELNHNHERHMHNDPDHSMYIGHKGERSLDEMSDVTSFAGSDVVASGARDEQPWSFLEGLDENGLATGDGLHVTAQGAQNQYEDALTVTDLDLDEQSVGEMSTMSAISIAESVAESVVSNARFGSLAKVEHCQKENLAANARERSRHRHNHTVKEKPKYSEIPEIRAMQRLQDDPATAIHLHGPSPLELQGEMYMEDAEGEGESIGRHTALRRTSSGPEDDSASASSEESSYGDAQFGNVQAKLRSAQKQGQKEFWDGYFQDGGSAFGEASIERIGTAGR